MEDQEENKIQESSQESALLDQTHEEMRAQEHLIQALRESKKDSVDRLEL